MSVVVLSTSLSREEKENLRKFLKKIDLSEYLELLESEDITIEILKKMSNDDLKSIGINTFGHRFPIREGIENFDQENGNETVQEPINDVFITFQGVDDEVPTRMEMEDDIDDNSVNPEFSQVFWFKKVLSTDRITHHVAVDFYRFDRKLIQRYPKYSSR